jgi:ClpP class serine protease
MRVNHLLSALLQRPFAIHPETAMGYLPLVANLLNGVEGAVPAVPVVAKKRVLYVSADNVGATTMAAHVAGRQRVKSYDDAPEDSVAIHSLKGPMLKQDQIGLCTDVPGTASLARAIQAADAHEHIVAHVLDIDSGGGAVDGTSEFAAVLAGLTKPVVAYSDGMIASAAYWAASACNRIVLNNATCAVGSIGVMSSLIDYQPALERSWA